MRTQPWCLHMSRTRRLSEVFATFGVFGLGSCLRIEMSLLFTVPRACVCLACHGCVLVPCMHLNLGLLEHT